MNYLALRSFQKDFRVIRDKKLLERLSKVIDEIEQATAIEDVGNVATMSGAADAFRIRVGDYRLGCYLVDGKLVLARFLHRKEIYRYFP